MGDRKEPGNHEEQKLVRVGGRGSKKQVYDSFGHEIPSEEQDVQKKQRVHTSHKEEVMRRMQEEQSSANASSREEDFEGKPYHAGYSQVSNPEIRKDKLRSYQRQQLRKKESKKNRILVALRVGIFLMCIAILVLVVLISGKMNNRVNTQFIRTGSINQGVSGTLSFLRNEIPVQSPGAGTFVAYVQEGERVAKDALIGYVIQSGYEAQLEQLRSVESKLTTAQQMMSYVNTAKSPELLVVEEGISDAVSRLSVMAMTGNMADYEACARELNQLYKEKNEILMNAETTDSYLQGLQQQRNTLLVQIQNSMQAVQASESGVVSFFTDGRELNAGNACAALETQLSGTDFDSPSSCRVSDGVLDTFTLPTGKLNQMAGTSVTAGVVIARITPDVSYYITMEMENGESQEVLPGRNVIVRMKEQNLSFEANVCGVYQGESRKVLVLTADSALMATISQRAAPGEVLFSSTEGLKVPLRALTEWDDAGVTARITVVRSGYVEYVYVNILASDHDYAIINSKATLDDGDGISVRENDEYVVEYEKVREGQAL